MINQFAYKMENSLETKKILNGVAYLVGFVYLVKIVTQSF